MLNLVIWFSNSCSFSCQSMEVPFHAFNRFVGYMLQDIIAMYLFRIRIISQRIIKCKFLLSQLQPFSPFISFLNFINRFYQLIKEMPGKIMMDPEVNMECIEILILKTENQFFSIRRPFILSSL